jgi:hypothetical protein
VSIKEGKAEIQKKMVVAYIKVSMPNALITFIS